MTGWCWWKTKIIINRQLKSNEKFFSFCFHFNWMLHLTSWKIFHFPSWCASKINYKWNLSTKYKNEVFLLCFCISFFCCFFSSFIIKSELLEMDDEKVNGLFVDFFYFRKQKLFFYFFSLEKFYKFSFKY